jgi:two-component system, NtrC family, response regulator AtoC
MDHDAVSVIFCSPDKVFIEVIARTLGPGFEIQPSDEPSRTEGRWQHEKAEVVLLDFRDTGEDASIETKLRSMDDIKEIAPSLPIIAILDDREAELTRKVIENGAYDTLVSPPNMAELRVLLRRASKFCEVERELSQLQQQERSASRLGEMIGINENMQKAFALVRKVAPCDVTVFISGETGTGKELLARAIHRLSARASGPFMAFSCANLPETLVEDELFGHEKGAFTGAIASRRGRLEAADGGTLFLDEVGDLPLSLQDKLLRVLQQRSFERLGSNSVQTTDVRVVCATHCNLEEMVKEGTFRSDLYFRLNVVKLHLPPLRERREEIPILAQYFLRRYGAQFGKRNKRFSPLALHALEEYSWPGNVREFENVIQHSIVISDGATIEIWHLPEGLRMGLDATLTGYTYEQEVRDFKRRLILRTLRKCGGCKAEAARTLGVARGYLHRLINQLQIPVEPKDLTGDLLEENSSADRLM